MARITRILVPTDFSPTADAALEYAFVLAERFGASLQLLHVLDDPFVVDGMAADAYIAEAPALRTAVLDDARERLRHRAAPREVLGQPIDTEVLFGHGARTIAEYAAERGVDLIVMGTHGRSGFAHLLLGSVAERLVRTAPCPVLTVRHPEERKRAQVSYDVERLPA
jgi:nucleotide-binding universal stress UspA family protein